MSRRQRRLESSGTGRSEARCRLIHCLGLKAHQTCTLPETADLGAVLSSDRQQENRCLPRTGVGRLSLPSQCPPGGHSKQACSNPTQKQPNHVNPTESNVPRTKARRRGWVCVAAVALVAKPTHAELDVYVRCIRLRGCLVRSRRWRRLVVAYSEREFPSTAMPRMQRYYTPALHWQALLLTAVRTPTYRCVLAGQKRQLDWPCSSW